MKFGKVLCGSLAALMAMSTTAIAAQAEETARYKLVTAGVSDITGENAFNYNMGCNIYADSKNNFYMLDDKALEEWKKTGKADFTKLSCDTDLSGMEFWGGNFDGGYVQFVKRDSDNNITERKALRFDKASDMVKLAYTLPADWSFTNSDGYTISFIQTSDKELNVITYDPSGNKTTKTMTFSGDKLWYSGGASSGGKYVGYFMWKSSKGAKEVYGDTFTVYGYEVYGVRKDGELDLINKNAETYGFGYRRCNENCVAWGDQALARSMNYKLYSTENNKIYELGDSFTYKHLGESGFYIMDPGNVYGKIHDERVILGDKIGPADDDMRYILVKLNEGSTAEPISKQYKEMSTDDGKTYLVKTDDDKWGYIDSNGNELAMFDDAGEFVGDYAPVVKNGKGYLIDRNMNKVSDEIAADGVGTFSEELFRFYNGNKQTLVTYAAAETKPDDTSSAPTSSALTSSEPTSSEPTSSAPASSDTTSSGTPGGNDNPNSGIAIALIPVALIGGAAVIVSKKRKK